ncbi:LysR family transcriptional regulator [Sphingobium sp. AN641]|uniref:LysR family transcriptional regulator n=1 Tax=Sphingobium sp. AN641 TaxID=3133443 RepID=UPI0030BC26E9
MRIDPKLIIHFAVIAEEGSFTRAARRLRVAQPWLSARLHKLEEMLGFRLIERTTRSLSLTEKGAEFLAAARNVAEASEAADCLALQLGRSNRGVLRIGAPPYSKAIRERRELIDAFAIAHPTVSVEIETGWSLALLGRLDRRDIDLAFIMGDLDITGFESVILRRFGVALTMARDHPWSAEPTLSPKALAGRPVEVFVRNLNPILWDTLYAPLIDAGAAFIEVPEVAEGPPDRMRSPDALAAYLDFGGYDAGLADVVRIPLAAPALVPFQLVRPVSQLSNAGEDFWQSARLIGGKEPPLTR